MMTHPRPPFKIRHATKTDVADILVLIKALAVYEKMQAMVIATEQTLHQSLFEEKRARVLLAEVDGKAIGFALFFLNYSTFLGKANIYLEDLFVDEAYRGHGIGKALLAGVAAETLNHAADRLDWVCLNWNTPSIAFYQRLGAEALTDWTVFRLQGHALKTLAKNHT